MAVIAVVNRKGGSGKSTLATHLAVHCARGGRPVLLADADGQRCAQAWLRRRSVRLPAADPIHAAAVEPNQILRPPPGTAHVVIDTPGGLRGFELARVVMYADAILIPVANSAFDRESAAACFAELQTLPRVATGRCRVAAVGMRVDARTRAAATLTLWAAQVQLPFVGILRDTQLYVRCVDEGLTLFDLPPGQVQTDLAQWQPILRWLAPVLERGVAPPAMGAAPSVPPAAPASTARAETAAADHWARKVGRLVERVAIPRFLQRDA